MISPALMGALASSGSSLVFTTYTVVTPADDPPVIFYSDITPTALPDGIDGGDIGSFTTSVSSSNTTPFVMNTTMSGTLGEKMIMKIHTFDDEYTLENVLATRYEITTPANGLLSGEARDYLGSLPFFATFEMFLAKA